MVSPDNSDDGLSDEQFSKLREEAEKYWSRRRMYPGVHALQGYLAWAGERRDARVQGIAADFSKVSKNGDAHQHVNRIADEMERYTQEVYPYALSYRLVLTTRHMAQALCGIEKSKPKSNKQGALGDSIDTEAEALLRVEKNTYLGGGAADILRELKQQLVECFNPTRDASKKTLAEAYAKQLAAAFSYPFISAKCILTENQLTVTSSIGEKHLSPAMREAYDKAFQALETALPPSFVARQLLREHQEIVRTAEAGEADRAAEVSNFLGRLRAPKDNGGPERNGGR